MTPQEIAALSREKKIEEAMLRGAKLLPGDVAHELLSFLTPTSLAIAAGSLAALGVAQAFGVGELADALLLAAALGFCGWGAVQGCEDLYHFVKTALGARTDDDLNQAARYFSMAVVKIGVTALMALLLKKPLRRFQDAGGIKSFKTMNYRPQPLQAIRDPPPPGTPPIQKRPLADSAGTTDPYGNIIIDTGLDADEARITLNHEKVHRFLSPRFGPFLKFRARLNITAYNRSAILRYIEEALAEGVAQGIKLGPREGFIRGLKFPIDQGYDPPYLSIDQMGEAWGQFIGIIVVDGQAMTVSLQRGVRQRQQQQDQASSPTAPTH